MKPRMRLLLAMPILAALALPAWADRDHDRDHGRDHDRGHDDRDHRDHDRDRHDHRDFHGRDFRLFSPFEFRLWTGGGWFHEWHEGRLGWWWVADGGWDWYPEPVYPYPTYVSEPVIYAAPPPAVIYAPPSPPPPVIYVAPPPPPRPSIEIEIPVHIR
jgi:hypothetical protein